MKLAHLGLVRNDSIIQREWVKSGELYYNPHDDSFWINATALRIGLLQGRMFSSKEPVYVDGDIYSGDQWIGFFNSSDKDSGVWYTATILLIPCSMPSQMGILRLEIK